MFTYRREATAVGFAVAKHSRCVRRDIRGGVAGHSQDRCDRMDASFIGRDGGIGDGRVGVDSGNAFGSCAFDTVNISLREGFIRRFREVIEAIYSAVALEKVATFYASFVLVQEFAFGV